jgi:hypothetical protein
MSRWRNNVTLTTLSVLLIAGCTVKKLAWLPLGSNQPDGAARVATTEAYHMPLEVQDEVEHAC